MIYFIRHGESEANVLGLFAGQKDDSRLTPRGEQQSIDAAKDILGRGIHIDRIVSSPLMRARKTAELIASVLGIPVSSIKFDKRAMEYDPGDLTDTLESEASDEVIQRPHGEEDPKEFQDRTMELITELKTLPGNTLLVSHAGIAKTIQDKQKGLDPQAFYKMPEYPNAKLIELG